MAKRKKVCGHCIGGFRSKASAAKHAVAIRGRGHAARVFKHKDYGGEWALRTSMSPNAARGYIRSAKNPVAKGKKSRARYKHKRLRDPKKFHKTSFRTIDPGRPGYTKAIIGCPISRETKYVRGQCYIKDEETGKWLKGGMQTQAMLREKRNPVGSTWPIPVIWRTWKSGPAKGEIIALFPTVPADMTGRLVVSYEHIGQHGAADPHVVMRQTPPAYEEDWPKFSALLSELREIGYQNLKGVTRITRKMDEERIAKARGERGNPGAAWHRKEAGELRNIRFVGSRVFPEGSPVYSQLSGQIGVHDQSAAVGRYTGRDYHIEREGVALRASQEQEEGSLSEARAYGQYLAHAHSAQESKRNPPGTWLIKRDGVVKARAASESEAWGKLQRMQSSSVHHALKYEGYEIVPPSGGRYEYGRNPRGRRGNPRGSAVVEVWPGWGYEVYILDAKGNVLEEYSAGDSPYDPQMYGTGLTSSRMLEKYGKQTAREQMAEHGIKGGIDVEWHKRGERGSQFGMEPGGMLGVAERQIL